MKIRLHSWLCGQHFQKLTCDVLFMALGVGDYSRTGIVSSATFFMSTPLVGPGLISTDFQPLCYSDHSFYKICLRLPGGVGAAPAGRPRCLSGGLPYPALQPLPESQDARCPIFRKLAWLRGSVEFSLPLDLAKIADQWNPLHSEVIGMSASHWKIRNTTKCCICGRVADILP